MKDASHENVHGLRATPLATEAEIPARTAAPPRSPRSARTRNAKRLNVRVDHELADAVQAWRRQLIATTGQPVSLAEAARDVLRRGLAGDVDERAAGRLSGYVEGRAAGLNEVFDAVQGSLSGLREAWTTGGGWSGACAPDDDRGGDNGFEDGDLA